MPFSNFLTHTFSVFKEKLKVKHFLCFYLCYQKNLFVRHSLHAETLNHDIFVGMKDKVNSITATWRTVIVMM